MPGGYVVRDANNQALAYIYSRQNEAEARQAKVLTMDEAAVGRQEPSSRWLLQAVRPRTAGATLPRLPRTAGWLLPG
jgi:hypothetical protein